MEDRYERQNRYYNAMPNDKSPRIRDCKVTNKDGSVIEYTIRGRLKKRKRNHPAEAGERKKCLE